MDILVENALRKYDKKLVLRPKQLECLNIISKGSRDLIVNLPVGYGKSIIYHLLPSILGMKMKVDKPSVIVISPLNIIQEDQMKDLRKKAIPACKLDIRGTVNTLEDTDAHSDSEEVGPSYELTTSSSLKDIVNGRFEVILCHPEAILNTEEGKQILNDLEFKSHVVGVVIDECHVIEEWGNEFRTAFARLDTLAAFFPDVPVIGLSGTLSVELLKKLPGKLGQSNPLIIQETPDRPNIFLEKKDKISSRDTYTIYENIFKPECDNLLALKETYPVTIIFMPMTYMSHAVSYLKRLMGEEDINSSLYSVIYSNQDPEVIKVTTSELKKSDPRIRLVLSTSVSGMGFDPENVTQVIHARPPRNLSQYLQEIGRAGRRGQSSHALLYYSNNDIAKNLPGIKSDIIDYCKNQETCLRQQLLSSFGFEKNPGMDGCSCCSHCKNTCSCTACTLGGLPDILESELSFQE